MTALGATVYGGFFVVAALWLALTRESADADESGAGPHPVPVLAGRGRPG